MRSLAVLILLAACGSAEAPAPFEVPPIAPRTLACDGHGVCAIGEHGVACSDGRSLGGAAGWRAVTMAFGPCAANGVGDLECTERRHSGARIASLDANGDDLAWIDEHGAVFRLRRDDTAPVAIAHPEPARMVGMPYEHVCILGQSGRVTCHLGVNAWPAPADPPASVVLAVDEVERISAGWPLCVVRHGALHCERRHDEEEMDVDELEPIPGLGGVLDVVTSGGEVLALRSNGDVHDFAVPEGDAAWDVGAPRLSDGAELADRGGGLRCVRRRTGEIACWGRFDGVESLPRRPLTAIAGVEGAIDVVLDETHACVATESGSVLCWGGIGASHSGPIGLDLIGPDVRRTPAFPPESAAPTAIDVGITGAVELSLLDDALCARAADGSMGCATSAGAGRPTWIPDDTRIAELDGPCARTEDGDVYCSAAGSDVPLLRGTTTFATYYQQVCGARGRFVACTGLGAAPAFDPFDAPARVHQRFTPSALAPATDLVGGPTAICGRARSGAWRCIGHNGVGQLGASPSRPTIAPIDFAGGPWDAMVLGVHRSCVWLTGGVVTCAGIDADGEPRTEDARGDGALTELPDLRGVRALALSERGAIAILADGRALSWGHERWGELGGGRARWIEEPTAFEIAP